MPPIIATTPIVLCTSPDCRHTGSADRGASVASDLYRRVILVMLVMTFLAAARADLGKDHGSPGAR
jgi:hypothetical protein